MAMNWLWLALLGVGVIVVFGGVSVFNGMPLSIQGFTLISFGTPTFSSSDPILSGQVYQFAVTQGGLSQFAEGVLPASSIPNASKGFKIDVIGTKNSCDYPILVDYQGGKIYKYGLMQHNFLESEQGVKTRCSQYGEIVSWDTKPSNTLNHYCLYRYPVSSYVGYLKAQANYSFESKWVLTIDGQAPIEKYVSNKATSLIQFSDVGYVKWVGNLVSGETCPDPSNQRAMGVYVNGQWQLINQTNYSDYKSNETSFLGNLGAQSDSSLRSNVDSLNNNYVPRALSTTTFANSVLYGASSVSNASAFINLSNQLQIPLFSLFIKADKLGFVQPIATPSIKSVSGTTFKTGDDGFITVNYMNVGTDRGAFDVWVSCSGATMKGNTLQTTLGAGESRVDYLPITGTCSSVTSVPCTVHVKTLSKEVTALVNATCNQQIVCEPVGKTICEDNTKIKKCNLNQTDYDLVEDCSASGKVCGSPYGILSCVDKSPIPPLPCPSNQYRDNLGNCVPLPCPTGQFLDPKTGQCGITCPSGYHLSTVTNGGFFGLFGGTTQSCVPDVDWAFIIIVLGALGVGAVLFFGFFGKGRKR